MHLFSVYCLDLTGTAGKLWLFLGSEFRKTGNLLDDNPEAIATQNVTMEVLDFAVVIDNTGRSLPSNHTFNSLLASIPYYDAATVTILNVYIILICFFYLHNVFFFNSAQLF